ncbi:dTDP-4-dehydrorhamnose reductase [Desulfosporosinus acidiphilus SJ4]|uniref:dTDP-4-dehydrorhamnose reductase n=1 Tax=Desulfosporosinus acidiphilus (strain DSM 22704 / JCM 16185 / SJ4) TaxID=646529 RepID=I4D1K1_DESAJ|nr:SDR family oxidoreductase [Desulfosporosinus acidiphilus]AFM39675.1 dTDP-4-dehydrorhamnose reductase [Desulfosporosinus acidiphilus SJ4]
MKKVLVLGATGMLGHTLFNYLSEAPCLDVYATVRSAKELSGWLSIAKIKKLYSGIDILQTDCIVKVLSEVKPDIVVNCIGIIKQLPEAQDPITTLTVNALLPHRLARLCSASGARFIHISSDCVFDGSKGNYDERDFSNAADLYGRTKFLGEVTYPHCLTLRTSIIGHELKGNFGLVEWFLGQKEKVRGFRKVVYSGLPTVEFSRIIRDYVIPNPELSGLYHVSTSPISKYELLKLIAVKYKKTIDIEPDNSIRLDRSLDSSKFRALTGYNPPGWAELIREMHHHYLQGPYQIR